MNKKNIFLLLFLVFQISLADDDEALFTQDDAPARKPQYDIKSKATKELYDRAQEALEQSDYSTAYELLKEVSERDDDAQLRARALIVIAQKILIRRQGDYKTAFMLLELVGEIDAAPVEQIESWRYLAQAYEEGKGVPRDWGIAIEFYKLLAGQTYDVAEQVRAHYKLGVLYQDIFDSEIQNSDLALQYFKKVLQQPALKEWHARVWYKFAEIATYGSGALEKDPNLVIGFLEKAANQNDEQIVRAHALFRLGGLYLGTNKSLVGTPDVSRALEYLEQAVTQEDEPYVQADACELLVHIFYKGYSGVDADVKKAIYYLEMIGEKKLGIVDQQVRAYVLLGDMYRSGELGVPKDEAKAVSYYQKAAACEEHILTFDMVEQRLKWVHELKNS